MILHWKKKKQNNFLSSFFEWYFPHKSMNVLCAFLILFFSYYYSGNKTAGKMDFIFIVVNNQVNWLIYFLKYYVYLL